MRRYATRPLNPPRIYLGRIPKGYAGTKKTVEHMQALIRQGAKDFYVRQKAIDILLAQGVKPKDYLGEIRALFQWVQRNVRYTKDTFRVEVLHSARRLLELRAGDCDDLSILLGSMLESIGHPVRVVLIGRDPRRPRLFSHVYLEANHKGRWIPLDATMPYPMGWAPRTSVREVIDIERESGGGPATSRPGPARRKGGQARAPS
jgi:transglutaminase-like putative cysteine protease